MFFDPYKNNEEKIKVFGILFIVLLAITGISNYYFFEKHTKLKGRLAKLKVSYQTLAKVSIFHALVSTIFAFLVFKVYAKEPKQKEAEYTASRSDEQSGGRRHHRRHRSVSRERRYSDEE
jgi:hypothetical protein